MIYPVCKHNIALFQSCDKCKRDMVPADKVPLSTGYIGWGGVKPSKKLIKTLKGLKKNG